jgi:hypothetical protein
LGWRKRNILEIGEEAEQIKVVYNEIITLNFLE